VPDKEETTARLIREGLEQTGLYHSFRLPDGRILSGAMPLEWLEGRLEAMALPTDLTGKRVLDIGPWDGFFTFEMERRGAEVTAIDYVDLDTFRELHRAMGSGARYERLDVYELDPRRFGTFDIVLCLGVLYHLKHPLLALERICAVTRQVCIVDTFVIDGRDRVRGMAPAPPSLEFYERAELGGQLDNWIGPTVSAVEALIRSAGFARAELLRVTDTTATVAAHRQWGILPVEDEPCVRLTAVSCHSHRGRCFESSKEEYLALWCEWPGAMAAPLDMVFPEIDGFGVAPLSCTVQTGGGLLVNARVPPGLAPGEHYARVRIGCAGWSSAQRFYVDLPVSEEDPRIVSMQDGVTWLTDEVSLENGWLTLWVEGLRVEADEGNTIVEVSGVPHFPEAVKPTRQGAFQVNIRLRPVLHAGIHEVSVLHTGRRSKARTIRLTGDGPRVRGLEALRE
jgi:tRNA (mo5U34)-methyltransferase